MENTSNILVENTEENNLVAELDGDKTSTLSILEGNNNYLINKLDAETLISSYFDGNESLSILNLINNKTNNEISNKIYNKICNKTNIKNIKNKSLWEYIVN